MRIALITGLAVLMGAALTVVLLVRQAPLELGDLQPYSGPAGPGGYVDLSDYLETARERARLPALGAIVVRREAVVAQGFVGLRRAGGHEPVSLQDTVHVGSLTKAITGTLAALLVEDGVLNWEDSPVRILGDLDGSVDPAWSSVTLEQLLKMTGGVSRTPAVAEVFDRWLAAEDRSRNARAQRAQLASAILSQPPAAAAGSRVEYSNHSYALAGHMLETAADQPFEALMARRLFAPLGLSSAGFGTPALVWGHDADGDPVAPGPTADNPAMLSPAGRAHMSLADYGRFMQFVLAEFTGDNAMLSQPQRDRLFAPAIAAGEPYAMGWEIRDELGPDLTVLAHTGSNTLWYAYAWLAPERDFAVMAVTNQGDASEALDAIVWRLVTAHFE